MYFFNTLTAKSNHITKLIYISTKDLSTRTRHLHGIPDIKLNSRNILHYEDLHIK